MTAQLVVCHIIDKTSEKEIFKYLNYNGVPTQCDPKRTEKILEGLEGALINLTHFIKVIYHTLNRNDLVRFACRGASVVLKDNCPGADLLVPLILKKPYTSRVKPKLTAFACRLPPHAKVAELISKTTFEVNVDLEKKD